MAFEPRTTYYYLVCLVTLVMVITGGVQLVNGTLDLLMPPEPYRPTSVELAERMRHAPDVAPQVSLEDLEAQSDREATRFEREQRRSAIRSMIGSLALILIAGPVYLYHWRKIRMERPTPSHPA